MLDLLKPIIGTPEAMLFLTVALGVLLGRQKLAGFSFGNAAGTLIAGTFLGAVFGGAVPDLSPTLKSVAFLLFVFAVGFQSGPQFFASLGRSTLPQALIAVVVAVVGLFTTALVARLFGLDQGIAIGVAAGGLTQTAMLGTAYGALNELGLSADALRKVQGDAAVAFALTYVFGTIGVVLFCSQVGPRLIGVNLKDAAQKLEAEQAKALTTGGELLDFRSLVARVFRVDAADGKTVGELERKFGPQAAVQRVRRNRADLMVTPDLLLQRGDLVSVQGYRPAIVKVAGQIGKEVAAEELVNDLLGDGAEVIVHPSFAGLSLHDAVAKLGAVGHGLFLRRIRRQSHDIPVTAQTILLPGDTLSLAGPADRLAAALPQIGTVANNNNRSDVAFLAAGLLVGVLIGLLTLTVAGLPITLSAGGGNPDHVGFRPCLLLRPRWLDGRAASHFRDGIARRHSAACRCHRHAGATDRRPVRWSLRPEDKPGAADGRAGRCTDAGCGHACRQRCRGKPSARARLHRALRDRQHPAHHPWSCRGCLDLISTDVCPERLDKSGNAHC